MAITRYKLAGNTTAHVTGSKTLTPASFSSYPSSPTPPTGLATCALAGDGAKWNDATNVNPNAGSGSFFDIYFYKTSASGLTLGTFSAEYWGWAGNALSITTSGGVGDHAVGSIPAYSGLGAIKTADAVITNDAWHRVRLEWPSSGTGTAKFFLGSNRHGSTPDVTLTGLWDFTNATDFGGQAVYWSYCNNPSNGLTYFSDLVYGLYADTPPARSATDWAATTHQGAAALTATSTLTAAVTVTRPAAAALTAAAVLVAAAAVGIPATVSLSGTSTLTASATTSTAGDASASLAAASTLTCAAVVGREASVALTSTSVLAAVGAVPTYYPGGTRIHARPTVYDNPHDATKGGPAVLGGLATEVEAISDDLNEAMLEGSGPFPTIRAAIAALWSAITGAKARANHTGTQTAATISDFDTQVRSNRLDQLAAPTGPVVFGSQRLTGLGTPTAPTDAVTKSYADSLPTGSGSSSFDLNFVHANDYGAVADGATNYLGAVVSGSTTFSGIGIANYADAPWRADDVGKTIRIGSMDHAAGLAPFSRTITAVASGGGSVTLSSAAPWSSQYAVAEWGSSTDNTAAIQDAIDDADGRIVLLGPGVYITESSLILRNGTKIHGVQGAQADSYQPTSTPNRSSVRSMLMLRVGNDASVVRTDYNTLTNGVGLENLQIRASVSPTTTTAAIGAFYIPGGAYSTNWYLRNILCDGGYNGYAGVWATQMWMENVVAFWTRAATIELAESPDNWIVNCGFGSDWRNTGTCMNVDVNSGNQHIMGTAFQFSRYGLVLNSSGNQIIGNRFADSADTGLMVNGSGNVVSSNMAYQIPGVTSGYSIGARTGFAINGNSNTVIGNSAVGSMVVSTSIAGNSNKVVTGASSGTTVNTGTGNTVV